MKKLITVVLPISIGLGLIGLTIWLFYLAKSDNAYLLLFGLGTALLVPISLSLIGFGLNFNKRKVDEKLSELSKITDIQTLLDKAKTTEEQIEILKSEYLNLEKSLRYNNEKISLELRRDDLIKKAKEIITELDSISKELEIVDGNLSNYQIPLEVQLLRERVFKKQVAIVRFGRKIYTYKRNTFPNIGPIPLDDLLFEIFKNIEQSQKVKLKNEIDKMNENRD